jgi:hypothetical protein
MKDMSKLFYIGLIIILVSCQKDKVINFDFRITVKDYYTNQPVEGRIVIMKYCDGANFVGGSGPCDSVSFDVTDTSGVVEFSGNYERGNGHGHVFDIIGGEVYQTYIDHRFWSWEEERVIELKPLVSAETCITSTLAIDSLTIQNVDIIGFSAYNFRFKLGDTVKTYIPTIPDHSNSISIQAFNNDTLIKWDRLSFTPSYQGLNKLEYEVK